MPGSGFRAPWRGRKTRNSAPNPRIKDRQPRHRQAPIQSPPVEARVSVRERSCIGFFAFNTLDLCPSSRLSHTHTTSLCRLFPVRRERDNLSRLLLSHPLRFRFKTRGDVKLNYMCHNILRSSKPTCGPSFRYRLSWSARRESKQADFHPETAKEGSTGNGLGSCGRSRGRDHPAHATVSPNVKDSVKR